MNKISNHNLENISINELFRYRTEYGELQCHRLKMPEGMAGELLIKVLNDEKALSIEEVLFTGNSGIRVLEAGCFHFAEKTASAAGISIS